MAFYAGTVDQLPGIIDHALAVLEPYDLDTIRHRLQSHALRYHTTAARAQRMFDIVGL